MISEYPVFVFAEPWYVILGSFEHFIARTTQHTNVHKIASTKTTTPIIRSFVVSIRKERKKIRGLVEFVVTSVKFMLRVSVRWKHN